MDKRYSQVAHMKSVGKKFDRWYDLLWFQKRIFDRADKEMYEDKQDLKRRENG